MIIIDYTSLYYTSIARTAVPSLVSGKFVQIRKENELYLVLSPKEMTKYHANIIERFCMDKGIEGSYDILPTSRASLPKLPSCVITTLCKGKPWNFSVARTEKAICI